jgi:hypothetical protein
MRRTVFLLLLIITAQIAFAQGDAENKKVEEALKTRKVSVIYQDTPLADVVRFFQSISDLNFVLDPKMEGVADIRIAIRVEDMPLNSALNLMLEPRGLAFCVKDGAVFISTKERIAEILGKGSKSEASGLKSGELLFVLTDGSRIKGAIKITELQLKTAYGTLTIPLNDILEIRFPVAGKESQVTEDEVKTVKFTVTGSLLIDKFEVKTTGGALSITKTDVERILFQSESPAKLEPGKEEWESAAAEIVRTISLTVEVFRVKFGDYPASETSARNATGDDRLLFEGTQAIDPSAAQSYTFKYTRTGQRFTCTVDTDRTNLKDFFIDETGVLRAAPSTGDGCQATDKSAPYSG